LPKCAAWLRQKQRLAGSDSAVDPAARAFACSGYATQGVYSFVTNKGPFVGPPKHDLRSVSIPCTLARGIMEAREHMDDLTTAVEEPSAGMAKLRDGSWRYADSGIEIPGAVTRTVGEIVDIKVIAERSGTPVAVLVGRSEIDRLPGLSWIPEQGKLLRTEPEEEFEVPWPAWEEHSNEPIGVRAPEWDSTGLDRVLAIQEREVRLARHAAELRKADRARMVAIATGLGKTRREISEVVSLTPVRVAQIVEEINLKNPVLQLKVKDFLNVATAVLRYVSSRELEVEDVLGATGCDESFIEELVEMGLLSQDGSCVRITEAGEDAEMYLRSKKRKDSA
jgi:hypothetical protein